MKVGDPAWVFDANHRIYPPNGGMSARPIYREHWRPRQIVGETSRSWLVGRDGVTHDTIKVPKSGRRQAPCMVLFSQQDVDERVWDHDNRHRIVEAVRGVAPSTLRRIAAMIDYKETT